MANREHKTILRQGVTVWNQWRRANREVHPDLQGINLRAANLNGADFSGTKLDGADMSKASLWESNLSGASLSGVNLSGVKLRATNLREAVLYRTIFAELDLRGMQGLESVQHVGPSIISIDTLYRSGGHIPETFLCGCGLPNSMITYARALRAGGHAIDYYSCFISYCSAEESFAQQLHNDLQNEGVRCWYAPEDVKTDDNVLDRIDRSIRPQANLLIILSESSVASSWVDLEVKTALDHEQREGRQLVFPISIDDAAKDSVKDWVTNIRDTRPITDFRQWKKCDAYTQAFAQLLRDLRAGSALR